MTPHRSEHEHKATVFGRMAPGSSLLLAMLMLVALPAVGAAAMPAAAMVLEVTLRDAPRREHQARDYAAEYECISSSIQCVSAPLTSGEEFEAIATDAPDHASIVLRADSRVTARAGLLDLPPPAAG